MDSGEYLVGQIHFPEEIKTTGLEPTQLTDSAWWRRAQITLCGS